MAHPLLIEIDRHVNFAHRWMPRLDYLLRSNLPTEAVPGGPQLDRRHRVEHYS